MTSILDSQYLLDYSESTQFPAICNNLVTPVAEYNLNGSKATVCINVANQCAESTIRQKQSVFLLPSLLRVVVASERAVNPDKWLTNVNALVGCPLVTCGDVILDDLPAPSQSIVLLAKLGVIVWLKELVAVYCVCEEEQIRYCVREAMMESWVAHTANRVAQWTHWRV